MRKTCEKKGARNAFVFNLFIFWPKYLYTLAGVYHSFKRNVKKRTRIARKRYLISTHNKKKSKSAKKNVKKVQKNAKEGAKKC